MKRLLFALALLAVLVAGVLGTLYFFGLWNPNSWVARAYPVQGIDVSNHQGAINWTQAAADGVEFAYIKATEGGDFRDRSFAENWRASAQHGVVRGAYHFFTMKASGLEQAKNMVAAVPVDPKALPPAVDLEFYGNARDRRTPAEFRKELEAFLEVLRRTYGKEPVIYTDSYYAAAFLPGYEFKRVWIPSYFSRPSWPKTGWQFWQFAERGRCRGINGYVDRNVFNGNREDFRKFVQSSLKAGRTD